VEGIFAEIFGISWDLGSNAGAWKSPCFWENSFSSIQAICVAKTQFLYNLKLSKCLKTLGKQYSRE
jgi:hypothetical protein